MKIAVLVAVLILIPVANANVLIEAAVADDEKSNEFNDLLFDMWKNNEIYYVMMPIQNEFAQQRMNDYNATYPMVFLDGGYRIARDSHEIQNFIKECNERRKSIKLEIKAEWIECPCVSGLHIETTIKNNNSSVYNGTLYIYIIEINSRWKIDGGTRYHFSFLEFANVENISLKPYEELCASVIWDNKQHFPVIYDKGKNIAVIAAVFNQKGHRKYIDSNKKFEAHYLDGIALYMPPNAPPYITISYPKSGYVYMFGRELFKLGKTIIIGGIEVFIKSWDDKKIEKIEVYKDGKFWKALNENEFLWEGKGYHSIEVIAYDDIQSFSDSRSAFFL